MSTKLISHVLITITRNCLGHFSSLSKYKLGTTDNCEHAKLTGAYVNRLGVYAGMASGLHVAANYFTIAPISLCLICGY